MPETQLFSRRIRNKKKILFACLFPLCIFCIFAICKAFGCGSPGQCYVCYCSDIMAAQSDTDFPNDYYVLMGFMPFVCALWANSSADKRLLEIFRGD